MITYMTTAGTFAFFTVITLLGAVYFAFEMENTDGLSSAQCKQVYWPEAFKQHTESLLGDGGKLIEDATIALVYCAEPDHRKLK